MPQVELEGPAVLLTRQLKFPVWLTHVFSHICDRATIIDNHQIQVEVVGTLAYRIQTWDKNSHNPDLDTPKSSPQR